MALLRSLIRMLSGPPIFADPPEVETDPPIIVVSGDFEEYRFYSKFCDQPRGSFRYLFRPTYLMGCQGRTVHLIGGYLMRADWPEIRRALVEIAADVHFVGLDGIPTRVDPDSPYRRIPAHRA
jgi:hypothetical protein